MKIKFIMLLFLSGTLFCYAQSGNVGINTDHPGSTLAVNGSLSAFYNTVTDTDYDMKETDFFVSWLGTSDGTLNLPDSATGNDRKGRIYYIKNLSKMYPLTVDAYGSELIERTESIRLKPSESALLIKTDNNSSAGTTYEIVLFSKTSGDYVYSVSSEVPETHHEGVLYKADFTAIDFSPNNGVDFNLDTDIWTCPRSGYYKIELMETGYHSAKYVSAHRRMSIYKNGIQQTKQFYTIVLLGVSANQLNSGYDTTFVSLEKGDEINGQFTFCNGCGVDHMTSTVRKMIITKL